MVPEDLAHSDIACLDLIRLGIGAEYESSIVLYYSS